MCWPGGESLPESDIDARLLDSGSHLLRPERVIILEFTRVGRARSGKSRKPRTRRRAAPIHYRRSDRVLKLLGKRNYAVAWKDWFNAVFVGTTWPRRSRSHRGRGMAVHRQNLPSGSADRAWALRYAHAVGGCVKRMLVA